MQLKDVLIVYTIPRTKEQKSTLEIVKRILKKYKFNCKLANRDKLSKTQFQDKDLIIAVGGDGTFLRAAQFTDNQLIFGVNADVKNKEGFLMKANKKDFEIKLKKIIKNEAKIKKLPRLEAYINNQKIETLALNEFFIGSRKSYHAAKYSIGIYDKKEIQKSSGILVTTPVGSYAWAKSCCERTLPLNSSNYQFIVREPYMGKELFMPTVIHGEIKPQEKMILTSTRRDNGVLAINESVYDFNNGDVAEIFLSDKPLQVVFPLKS